MSAILKQKEAPLEYPSDVMSIIGKLSFDVRNTQVMGSQSLKSQQYAADYDCLEEVSRKGGKTDTLAKGLARGLQSIVRGLLDTRNCYIGDIKCGEIPEWRIVSGKIQDGKVVGYDAGIARSKVDALFEQGIISMKERNDARKFLVEKPSIYDFIRAEKEIRFQLVRWTPKDILAGFIVLRGGRKFRLEDAIQSPGLCKIDVVAFVQNNRFTDFSCIYIFKHNGRVLNDVQLDPEIELKKSVLSYWMDRDYYKMAKRIFSLARLYNETERIEELTTMFNGDLGRLYSIISDAKTILYLLENESVLPLDKIRFELDQFRGRLANIYSFQVGQPATLERLLAIQDLPNTASGRASLERAMTRLVEFFQVLLNKHSKSQLKKLGLYPVPKQYLP